MAVYWFVLFIFGLSQRTYLADLFQDTLKRDQVDAATQTKMAPIIPPSTPDREIVTYRVVHAPKEAAFRMWSEARYLKSWWGPAGFTNTFMEFDFRVGGRWNFIMHGPDKGNYRNECEFTLITSPSVIAWKRFTQPLFQVVVTFEKTSTTETKVVFRQIFATAEECTKIKSFVADKNEEVFDRMEAELRRIHSDL